MPGVLGYSWRDANRSEYLAQYFLSALGVSVPVLRQEDIGVDFQCALAKDVGRHKITFGAPFAVQVGSLEGKDFVYGGYASDDAEKKKWRKEGIEWLFAQEIPFFVGTVDRVRSIFRLYATSPMWLLRINFPTMTELRLCPDECHDPLRESRSKELLTVATEHGDGYSYRVPLGNPIVQLTMADLEDEARATITKAREVLSFVIHFDQLNITYRRSGIKTSYWFLNIVPNDVKSLQEMGGGIAPADEPQALDVLRAAAISLAMTYAHSSDQTAIAKLAPVFGLFNPAQVPDWIQTKLPAQIRAALNSQTQSSADSA